MMMYVFLWGFVASWRGCLSCCIIANSLISLQEEAQKERLRIMFAVSILCGCLVSYSYYAVSLTNLLLASVCSLETS